MTDFLIEQARAGEPLSCFVLDSHCHIGEVFFNVIDPSADGLIRSMDRCGINVAAVSSTPGCLSSWTREGNDQVIAAVNRYPDRIIGLTTVDPHRPDVTVEELSRCFRAGLKGIKIHDYTGVYYDDPAYESVWRFAQEHGLGVLSHCWGRQTVDRLTPFFRKYPRIKWVLGHAGAVDWNAPVRAAQAHDNVYLELCLSACPRGLVEHFVALGLADRVLFGSDAVFMDNGAQIGRVVFAKISPADKLKILGENARKVWF